MVKAAQMLILGRQKKVWRAPMSPFTRTGREQMQQ
jgi:hypothetical protein